MVRSSVLQTSCSGALRVGIVESLVRRHSDQGDVLLISSTLIWLIIVGLMMGFWIECHISMVLISKRVVISMFAVAAIPVV